MEHIKFISVFVFVFSARKYWNIALLMTNYYSL
jgi:hypothetical protein